MIRVVAIDTSTWWGGVALVQGAEAEHRPSTIAEAGLSVRGSHARHILTLLDVLLAEASWDRSTIDGFVATRGPGSFTGIRVALGTVRGLSLAASRPALGVGTLDAMATAHGPDYVERIPMLDAGRGEVYAARFSPASFPPKESRKPWLGDPRSVLGDGEQGVLFGPGVDLHREAILESGAEDSIRRSPTSVAAAAGHIGVAMLASGAPDGTGMAPLYIRPPDAILKPRPGR